MAGEGVVVGVNESYKEMRGKHGINATVVGDADRELCCFEERQIDLIHVWRENAKKGGYENVEFKLGEIENLPVADNSIDVVISNCVINLSPDKSRVFAEAFRVLKPSGRLMISDIDC